MSSFAAFITGAFVALAVFAKAVLAALGFAFDAAVSAFKQKVGAH